MQETLRAELADRSEQGLRPEIPESQSATSTAVSIGGGLAAQAKVQASLACTPPATLEIESYKAGAGAVRPETLPVAMSSSWAFWPLASSGAVHAYAPLDNGLEGPPTQAEATALGIVNPQERGLQARKLRVHQPRESSRRRAVWPSADLPTKSPSATLSLSQDIALLLRGLPEIRHDAPSQDDATTLSKRPLMRNPMPDRRMLIWFLVGVLLGSPSCLLSWAWVCKCSSIGSAWRQSCCSTRWGCNFSVERLLLAGMATDCRIDLASLKEKGALSSDIMQLKRLGISFQTLRNAGASSLDLARAGYTIGDFRRAHANTSVNAFWRLGATVTDMRALGFSYAEMFFGGVPSKDLRRYEFTTVTKPPGDSFWIHHQPDMGDLDGPAHQLPGSFPPVYSLPDIWSSVIDRARADPCSDEVLHPHFVLTHKHSGFCSRMNNLVNEMLVAIYSGKPVAPCANPDIKNLWAENFDVPDLPVCKSCNITRGSNSKEWLWSMGFSMALKHQTAEMEFTKRFLYKQLFVAKSRHKKAAYHAQRELGLLEVPYVGIHIRRGDKVAESPTQRSTEAFAENAWRLCQGIGCKKIFVASDSAKERPQVATHIAKWSNASIEVVEQSRMAAETYGQRGDLQVDAAQALMVDILLLIRATAYIGTASSNVDRFVWFLRDPGTQSVSLDDFGMFLLRSG